MKIISLVNTKGGVGKTVSAIHLGAALSATGSNVLLIDVDLQGGLSRYFGIDTSGTTTADVLSGAAGIEEAIQPLRERLSLVPANASMEKADVELSGGSGGEVRLRRAFKRFDGLSNFDYVFIDCPSGWSAVTRNALLASHAMIVPINSEPAAISNAVSTIANTRLLNEYHDHDLQLLGVLITRYRGTNAAKYIHENATELWGDAVFNSKIRQTERVNELAMQNETLSDVSASIAGGVGSDYAELAAEFRARTAKY